MSNNNTAALNPLRLLTDVPHIEVEVALGEPHRYNAIMPTSAIEKAVEQYGKICGSDPRLATNFRRISDSNKHSLAITLSKFLTYSKKPISLAKLNYGTEAQPITAIVVPDAFFDAVERIGRRSPATLNDLQDAFTDMIHVATLQALDPSLGSNFGQDARTL